MFKTRFTLLVATILVATSTYPAEAADLKVAAQSAVSGFQQSLNATLDAMNILEDEHAKNTAEINQVNLEAVAKVSATQAADLLALSNNYLPKMSASSSKITAAKAKILTVSSVKVLKLGTNRNYWGNLKCPPLRQNCISLDDKGALFVVGETTTFLDVVTQSADYLYEIDLMISYGLIELLNPIDFQAAGSIIRSEPAILNALTASYSTARIEAQTKYNRAVSATAAATANALAFENNRYEQALEDLELQQAQAESFILAAKRASKDYKSFNKAFTTALQFEYNRIMLGYVADAPWTAFTSLRSLSSLVKVIALADFADATASRYTMANAAKLNASVGNTFTKDPTFSASLKTSKALYSKVIKS